MESVHTLAMLGWALTAAVVAGTARADDTPPPQGWSGKGELGVVFARGNTDADTVDAKLGVADSVGDWKHILQVDVLQAKSNQVTSADRDDASLQSDYNLSTRSFLYGSIAYIDDRLSGFAYQRNATLGYGHKFLDSGSDKLNAEIGIGYGQEQPETLIKDADGNVIGRIKLGSQSAALAQGEVKYEHDFNKTTKITEDLKVNYQDIDTFLLDDLALVVAMTTKLSLSVAFELRHNSAPPAPSRPTDTLSTVNLVYAF
jgi:putative salt-induced outer membrane protein